MGDRNYQWLHDCVDVLTVFAKLSVDDMKDLLPLVNQKYHEAAIAITGIKIAEKVGYDDLAQITNRSSSHVRKIVVALIEGGFPIHMSEDYLNYNGKGKPRALLELKTPVDNELEEHTNLGLDSDLESWVSCEANKVGLSQKEFVCSALALFKARQDNNSMLRLKEKYSREAQVELLLH